jgi:hypothetical protein
MADMSLEFGEKDRVWIHFVPLEKLEELAKLLNLKIDTIHRETGDEFKTATLNIGQVTIELLT